MVILRATQKVLKALPESAEAADVSDTALGDWYVNRIVVDRQPLLLFVSSASRLAMLVPAREVKTLPDRFAGLVADRLRRMAIDWSLIAAEMAAMECVRVGRTRERSITGQMVDFAKTLPYCLTRQGWDATDLRLAEEQLARTPCLAGRRADEVIFPDDKVVQLLKDRWIPTPMS